MKSSKDNSVKVQDLLATKDWPYDEKYDSEGILNNRAHKRRVNESGAGYNALYAKMSDEELNKLAASKDPSKRMAIFQAKREIERRKSLPPSKQMDPENQMDLIRQARRQGKTLDQIRRGA